MSEIIDYYDIPEEYEDAIIKVIGVGGGGSNAVNHMFREGIKDVEFVVCNTDAQALVNSPVPVKIRLGETLTEGRGAGNKPEIGRESALESVDRIKELLDDTTKMVFITAGMGGGTGTGAAPVIAEIAKGMGILTVGIVTIPFRNEGKRRINQAIHGIKELEGHVDSLLIINNERICDLFGDFPISEAFAKADGILSTAAKGIAEIITVHGYINVDFADIETVMRDSGVAIMGSASSEGENRALEAIEEALNSPLLNNNNIDGAQNILINITSGEIEATMTEVSSITNYVQGKAGNNADLIWGNGSDRNLGNKISVTVIATGFSSGCIPELREVPQQSVQQVAFDQNMNSNSSNGSTTNNEGQQQAYSSTEQQGYNGYNTPPNHNQGYNTYAQQPSSLNGQYGNLYGSPTDRINNQNKNVNNAASQAAIESLYNPKQPETSEDSLFFDYNTPVDGKGAPSADMRRSFDKVSDETIDEISSVPAYLRRKAKSHNNDQEISRSSIHKDSNNNDRGTLRNDNRFLHDNMD